MYIRNIKNAKLTLFAFGMPPSCYQRGENCFMQNSRAYYLVLYLSQEGISVIFILPLSLGLCNLPESQISCLIFYHGERIYNPIIKPLYSGSSETLRTTLLHVNHSLSPVQEDGNISAFG